MSSRGSVYSGRSLASSLQAGSVHRRGKTAVCRRGIASHGVEGSRVYGGQKHARTCVSSASRPRTFVRWPASSLAAWRAAGFAEMS